MIVPQGILGMLLAARWMGAAQYSTVQLSNPHSRPGALEFPPHRLCSTVMFFFYSSQCFANCPISVLFPCLLTYSKPAFLGSGCRLSAGSGGSLLPRARL